MNLEKAKQPKLTEIPQQKYQHQFEKRINWSKPKNEQMGENPYQNRNNRSVENRTVHFNLNKTLIKIDRNWPKPSSD